MDSEIRCFMVTSDLNHEKLASLGPTLFGTEYLSETTKTPAHPIRGKIHGLQGRLLANLLVWSNKRKPINVVFVVDTGAGGVMLSIQTLRALFPFTAADELDKDIILHVHCDRETLCTRSGNQAEGLNMLGYTYLESLDLSIVFDFEKEEFQLIKVPVVQPDHDLGNTK